MTDLSVCIVAYHDYEDILNAVDSIMEHNGNKYSIRIYIVDNDSVFDIKGEFRNRICIYQNVEYIDAKTNLGFGKGHNYIIPFLDSKYHAIVNPDVLLIEDVFSKIIDFLSMNNDIGMVVPKIVDENGKLQEAYREELTVFDMFIRMFCRKLFPRRIARHTLQNMDFTKSFKVPFAQGSFLVIRTELFKDLRGFDDKFFMYLEDADLCRRVNLVSNLIYYPEVMVIHKWEKGSHKNRKLFKYHIESMNYYFSKWGIKWF